MMKTTFLVGALGRLTKGVRIINTGSVRVRFAPSPTGFVHIGGLRTALYNYLFAKNHGGTFILRIEDTDQSRFVPGATENLLHVLGWAELIPDEGPRQGGPHEPYFQSQRSEIYRKHALDLLEKGFAYYAFDTPHEIEAMRQRFKAPGGAPAKYDFNVRMQMRNSLTLPANEVADKLRSGEPHVIRLKVPENRIIEFNDVIRGRVSFDSAQLDDQVLLKSDGFPTYHLANVVDDHLMEITHVIRGEEWLSSVPKHLLLYESFGWQPPVLAHLPLIFNPDGSKMSKRDIQSLDQLPSGKVDPDVQSYIRKGYEKSAIINYIALLGWNPGEGDDRQVFSLDELVREFSLERVNKSAAIFDLKKLDWLNSEHIKRRDIPSLVQQIAPALHDKGWDVSSEEYLGAVVRLLQPRVTFVDQFITFGEYFFIDPQSFDESVLKKRWKEDSAKLILEFCSEISKLTAFDAVRLEAALKGVAEWSQANPGHLIHPVRLAVTGVGVGPGLYEVLELLGRETVIRRLETAVSKIKI